MSEETTMVDATPTLLAPVCHCCARLARWVVRARGHDDTELSVALACDDHRAGAARAAWLGDSRVAVVSTDQVTP